MADDFYTPSSVTPEGLAAWDRLATGQQIIVWMNYCMPSTFSDYVRAGFSLLDTPIVGFQYTHDPLLAESLVSTMRAIWGKYIDMRVPYNPEDGSVVRTALAAASLNGLDVSRVSQPVLDALDAFLRQRDEDRLNAKIRADAKIRAARNLGEGTVNSET